MFSTKITFPSRICYEISSLKMFPKCSLDVRNIATLREHPAKYSRNIACLLGRDNMVINKQGCASLLKEAIKFLLHNCFSSIGNIIMIQAIRIPMGSDPALLLANLFLAHKKAGWDKAQRKLGTIKVRKINNSFRFIDDLLSLNDGSNFEKSLRIFIQQN